MSSSGIVSRTRHVIVNADDFGMSPQINQGILQAFQQGLISSATIMANMPAFQDACSLVHKHGLRKKVGLHLNFTDGKPLTRAVARCEQFCDEAGNWRPQHRVLSLSAAEARALETEISAQVQACERNGFTPTHWDSHHHMHTEFGMAPLVIRLAKKMGVRALRLGINCGPGRTGASAIHRLLASAYRGAYNAQVKWNGLARTKYFGDLIDTSSILATTRANTEVMVHPTLDDCGRLIDADGTDLKKRIKDLNIPAAELCSYAEAVLS